MLEKDMEVVEKYLGVFLGQCECKDAWLRIKKDYMELAQQTHNSQSVSLVGCDRCDNIADHHFCDECLESYEH